MILVQPIGAAVAAPTPPAQRPAARLQRDGVTRSASPGAPSIGTPWPATTPSGASLSFRCCASVSTGSLLSAMAYDVMPGIEGTKMGVNYGLNSLRFLAPVKSGSKVRGNFSMADVVERSPGVFMTTVDVKVEIEGEDKPALAAEWVTLSYV